MEERPPTPPQLSGAPPVLSAPPVLATRTIDVAPPERRIDWGHLLKKRLGPAALIAFLILKWFGKVKFLFMPLVKFFPMLLKTGGTMILAVGAYMLFYGWKFAVGLVLLIFVHELGHLVAARKVGLKVGAPVFIPFLGAFIALKEAPRNAWIEAQVGIGGPLLGTLGAVLCLIIDMVFNIPIFRALAYVGFFLNLFNLAPIGFLDGGRIATALSPWLWVVGFAIMLALVFVSLNPILILILVLSLPRLFSLFRKQTDEERRYFEVTPRQRATMALIYFGLAGGLAFGMKLVMDAEIAAGTIIAR